MIASETVLALRSVVKQYPGGVTALRGVSVEIGRGEQVAVVGPSGSGKTTMLAIMGTLERPTSGQVRVDDRDLAAVSDADLAGLRAHQVGFVFQAFHLQEAMTAIDNVALGMLYTGNPLKLRREAARLALERVGLRSRVAVVNPATGGIVATIPEKHPGGRLSFRGGGGGSAAGLLAATRSLPPAGAPPDLQNPELLRQVLLALALRDENIGGAQAAELADRALELTRGDAALDPPAALEAARNRSN